MKEYILAGDAFQVVLSQRFSEPAQGARPLDVYRALRVINPSPYMFHLRFPEAEVTGARPPLAACRPPAPATTPCAEKSPAVRAVR